MPNCGCQKYTPQIPPVNSREDTGLRGEECDCVCGDCKGRRHFNYKDVKCINYQPPLADRVECPRCYDTGKYVEEDKNGAVLLMTCDHSPEPLADRVGGECNGIAHYFPEDELTCSCGQMGRPSTPPSKQSEEVFGMKVEVDETMPDRTWKLKEGKPTPPKAEGGNVKEIHNSSGKPSVAEGVGEWIGFLSWINSLSAHNLWKDPYAESKVPKDIVQQELDRLLTSATRAAKERRDGELRRLFLAYLEFRGFRHDDHHYLLYHDLKTLPPPPDKPTQPHYRKIDRRPVWDKGNGEIEPYTHQDENYSNLCAARYCRCQS